MIARILSLALFLPALAFAATDTSEPGPQELQEPPPPSTPALSSVDPYDPCDGVTCNGNGDCLSFGLTSGYTCFCDDGYDGTDCGSCAAGYVDDGGACEIGFALPLEEPDLYDDLVIGVDHDWPASREREKSANNDGSWFSQRCETYDGRLAPHCYDGHDGNDFMLLGGFATMDQDIAWVRAAAPGTVTTATDGYYDRCHFNLLKPGNDFVDCDGYTQKNNEVRIEHADGTVTVYAHLATSSVVVGVHDEVECGDILGLVGSSGTSLAPHLHFEVLDADGLVIDPYADGRWFDESGSDNGLPGTGCE